MASVLARFCRWPTPAAATAEAAAKAKERPGPAGGQRQWASDPADDAAAALAALTAARAPAPETLLAAKWRNISWAPKKRRFRFRVPGTARLTRTLEECIVAAMQAWSCTRQDLWIGPGLCPPAATAGAPGELEGPRAPARPGGAGPAAGGGRAGGR